MTTKLLKKIELIEKDLKEIKKSLLKKPTKVSLKGILKGIQITERDIKNAKTSFFRGL